jgi:glycerol-3-phosphate dehydrogenase
LLQLAEGHKEQTIAPSQGIHLVVDKHFLQGETAMMIPKTEDGRVLFAIPWHEKLLLGTTDTPVETICNNPKPLQEEIDYIIRHFNRYTHANISYSDVKSVFAGLRPLAFTGKGNNTAELPRDHVIKVMPSGLVHVTGGKWTTYRRMAEKTIDFALQSAGLQFCPSKTKTLKIHGWTDNKDESHLSVYGSDAAAIRESWNADSTLVEKIHASYPYTRAEVKWFVEHEMAVTVEDVLARRLRLLFLDARAAIEAAPAVAEIIASCHAYSSDWVKEQVAEFEEVGEGFGLVNRE